MNLINTCRNISLHSEEILFNWQQEILYRFAIDWRCPFLDAIASPSTYPCQSVSEWVSQWVIVSDLEIAIASPSFASLLLQIRYNMDIYFIVGHSMITVTPCSPVTVTPCSHITVTTCSPPAKIESPQARFGDL